MNRIRPSENIEREPSTKQGEKLHSEEISGAGTLVLSPAIFVMAALAN